jgi:hypothetical protein
MSSLSSKNVTLRVSCGDLPIPLVLQYTGYPSTVESTCKTTIDVVLLPRSDRDA